MLLKFTICSNGLMLVFNMFPFILILSHNMLPYVPTALCVPTTPRQKKVGFCIFSGDVFERSAEGFGDIFGEVWEHVWEVWGF